jgi:hypothetical protein
MTHWARKEILALHHVIKLRGKTILRRSIGLMTHSHALMHHFNPACRAARLHTQLPVARLLMSLNDFDMPTSYSLNDTDVMTERILKVSIFPLFLVFFLSFLLPYTLQDAIIEALAITGFNFGVLSLYLLLALEVYIPIIFVAFTLIILGLAYYLIRCYAYRVEPEQRAAEALDVANIKALDDGLDDNVDDYMAETDEQLCLRLKLKPTPSLGPRGDPYVSDSTSRLRVVAKPTPEVDTYLVSRKSLAQPSVDSRPSGASRRSDVLPAELSRKSYAQSATGNHDQALSRKSIAEQSIEDESPVPHQPYSPSITHSQPLGEAKSVAVSRKSFAGSVLDDKRVVSEKPRRQSMIPSGQQFKDFFGLTSTKAAGASTQIASEDTQLEQRRTSARELAIQPNRLEHLRSLVRAIPTAPSEPKHDAAADEDDTSASAKVVIQPHRLDHLRTLVRSIPTVHTQEKYSMPEDTPLGESKQQEGPAKLKAPLKSSKIAAAWT